MTKTKLTTVEKRAQSYCQNVNRWGNADFGVEWKKSRMWGHNPVIESNEGKMCSISGCGYCKLSSALAYVLCFLFPVESDAFNEVQRTAGAGEGSVREALKRNGWILERTATGNHFDGFRLTRDEPNKFDL